MEYLQIISHGVVGIEPMNTDYGIGSLGFEDGSRFYADFITDYGENSYNMSDLQGPKNIDYIYFSACNTANPDVVNIAKAFFDYNPQVNVVGGWDGGVAFVRNYGGLPNYADKPTKSHNNDTFYN